MQSTSSHCRSLCSVIWIAGFVFSVSSVCVGQARPTNGLTAAKANINKLANDGKYDAAITAAKNAINRGLPQPEDQAWLRSLEEEKKERDRANSLRGENRIDEAIKAASASLDLKRKRNEYKVPDSMEDTRWVTDLKNSKVTSESGLSIQDLQQIVQMEFQDKWFDYKKELHEGGMLADAIAVAAKSAAELKAQKGKDDSKTVAAEAEVTRLQDERTKLLDSLREHQKFRDQYFETGDFTQAEVYSAMIIRLKQQIYGDNDLTVAISLAENARMEQRAGRWSMAERQFKKALDIYEKLYGQQHWRARDAQVAVNEARTIQSEFPDTRNSIRDVRSRTFKATRLLEKGRYFEALDLAQEDEKKIDGYVNTQKYAAFAANQACLAAIYRALGRLSDAETRQRRALQILEDVYGDEHPDVLHGLNTLHELSRMLGDTAQSLSTAKRSLALTEKVWGPAHGEMAVSLNNLGEAELAIGRIQQARGLFIQALKLSEQHFATHGQLWTSSLQNLAEVHRLWGEYAESARLLKHVVKNRTVGYGANHAITLDAQFRLAESETDAKNYAAADEIFTQIMTAAKFVYGPRHPVRAQYLAGLARLRRAQGDDAKAAPLLREVLSIARENLDDTFAVLSERQQLAMNRAAQQMLFAYIDLAVTQHQPGEEVYQQIVGWKGAILRRQQRLRLAADRPESAALMESYQKTSRELATLALAAPDPSQRDAVASQIARLSKDKERLESELSKGSDKFKASKEPFTLDKLKSLLPPDSALVDFLEYADSSPTAARNGELPKQRLVAFIVRPDRHVEQIGLGDAATIGTLGEQWRAEIMRGRGGVDRGLKALPSKNPGKSATALPQIELRKQLWEPLEPHLAGVKLLLISPDGVTAKLPLAALPGRDTSKFLIEEVPLVVAPSPSQLGELLASSPAESVGDTSLLVVGDVDFGASADTPIAGTAAKDSEKPLVVQRSAPRFGSESFSPLPGTGREVASIVSLFRERFAKGQLSELRGASATEGRLRDAGPRYRYLHLATHGFFAPEPVAPQTDSRATRDRPDPKEQREKITDLHPGLLSGIAMAGANSGNVAAKNSDTIPDDGVLTALEVASLDLSHVELTILSACETGLGQSAGGEGLLGLQRAFQVAGARSTVASLWKVDDAATQVLMTEFYRNLWERKLGKLESLRRAQLTMLQDYDPRQQKLVARGLKVINPAPTAPEQQSLPPYFWAAFTLSGDWR